MVDLKLYPACAEIARASQESEFSLPTRHARPALFPGKAWIVAIWKIDLLLRLRPRTSAIDKRQPTRFGLLSALTAMVLVSGSPAHALDGGLSRSIQKAQAIRQEFNIPEGPLGPALVQFSDQTGLHLIYGPDVTNHAMTVGVKGNYPTKLALEILLACSGINHRFTDQGTVMLERVVSPAPVVLRDPGDLMHSVR